VEIPHDSGAGRPSKKQKPDKMTYHIEGVLASLKQERMSKLFQLFYSCPKNQLDMEALSDQELIEAYKDQQKVERGYSELKDQMFMAGTTFLKSPKRIMALMMVIPKVSARLCGT